MEIILADKLQKLYANGQGIQSVSFTVVKGEFIGILGASGAGKTTLMRLLCGAVFPTSGSLQVLGHTMSAITRSELFRLRRQVATVYQNFNVVPSLSVAHNVLLGKLGATTLFTTLRNLLWLNDAESAKIAQLLTQLGIEDKFYERCQELSGGQQQRVAVARALYSQAELILADEPIASVDPATANLILNLFLELKNNGRTVIMNLHQISNAIQYCTRLIVLDKGQLAYDGSPRLFMESAAYSRLTGRAPAGQEGGMVNA
ncbi:phosphonate ABC transporter ATP-binding protein [Sporomusa sp. KB1]|jgi:phosphonate transport system ATP-binding protein|uniref:phosphonate ABC transporter ATP-binding protein n=1 Tax=Sporomusa sp. KB1 TaxID=943346 RepID=UPI0011A55EF5|nr:ATP-binding cassette domain-containing protein [Sporomusa sp. KB1]TWH47233.1 phosphonate transport system ATP-binding protein [Sporomusa sp. KB1]